MNNVDEDEEVSFGNDEIIKITGIDNILTYDKLAKYNSVEALLGIHKAVIILYRTTANYGHWTTLFKVNNNTLEFFDSLGFKVDEEFSFIDKEVRRVLGEWKPHLTAILEKSRYNIIQNTHKLQENKEGINTCGRWVSGRLYLRNTPLDVFVKHFTSGLPRITPDEMITIFTNNLLK